MKKTLLLALLLASSLHASQVRIINATGTNALIMGIALPPGQTAIEITESTKAMFAPYYPLELGQEYQLLVNPSGVGTCEQLSNSMTSLEMGFGFGLTIFGFGLVLRLYKKPGNLVGPSDHY